MNPKEIKALLEKYYKGESNLDEESILRDYFKSEFVDNEFLADKEIFISQSSEQIEMQNLPDISIEVWNAIKKQDQLKSQKNKSLLYFTLRIAASVIILLGFYFLLKDTQLKSNNEVQYTDTYDNPEEAYIQAKETLLYVSALLNKGAGHLESIQKISEGTKELSKLKSFNDGLMKLDPLNQFSISEKYLKQK